MADWVHCNSCFQQPGNGRKFVLTNCGHVYCENCTGSTGRVDKCKMCGVSCTTIQLSSNMKPDVELFFTDPKEMLKKQMKQLQQFLQVMDFQRNHRQRLSKYYRETMTKQDSMMSKAHKAVEQVRDLEREVIMLKGENSYLRKLVQSRGMPLGRIPQGHRGTQGLSPSTTTSHQTKSQVLTSSPYGADGRYGSQGPRQVSPSMVGPARISVRTPPGRCNSGQSRYGASQTPSPNSSAAITGSHSNMNHPPGGPCLSPMSCSPVAARLCVIPPTCMPFTPNRPPSPQFSTPGNRT